MDSSKFFFFAFLFGTFTWVNSSSRQDNSYLILAPNIFRPGSTFTLKVTILKATAPVAIVAGIRMGYSPKVKNIANNTGTFTVGATQDLNIKIPSGLQMAYNYRFFVNGSGGLTFYNESSIKFQKKAMTIYVQMDKGIYKPGQTAHMRIFALLPDLKTYLDKMTVDILDPNDNKMAHWENIQGPYGVIKKDFPISSQPVMGTWKVSVAARGEEFDKTFEVKEYVLPKFETSVTLPPYILKKDTKIQGSVTAKYTYGKGVKGSAVIEAYFYRYGSKGKVLEKEIEVDGTASFHFDMKEITELLFSTHRSSYLFGTWHRLIVNATVMEDLTKKKASGEQSLRFYHSDVKLEFPSFNPNNFKPGLEFNTILRVTQPDDQPIHPDRLKTLKIMIKTKYSGNGNISTDAYTPSSKGVILIRTSVPSWAEYVYLTAEHRVDKERTERRTFTAQKFHSPSNSFLQLSTSNPSVKSGDTINCDVVSTFPVTSYIYIVMARGKIKQIRSGNVSNAAKRFYFSFMSSTEMAPSCRLLVYCIRPDGEVVVDGLTVTVEDPFDNKVSLGFSRNSSRPGDQVNLVAKTTAGSQVSFLAVDKSVLLMKKDNDIDHGQVLRDLESFGGGSGWYPWWEWGWFTVQRRRRRMIMPFPASGSDAMSVFKNSGLIIFSDCLVYNKLQRYIHEAEILRKTSVEGASANGGDGRMVAAAGAPNLAAVTKVRSLFPETWLWIDVNASSSGEAEVSTSVPDTITSWVASAFAVSPTTGFGIGALKPKLQVFQPFFVSLSLPYSVVRGEEVAITALVFNYMEDPQEVTITFKTSKHWAAINELGARGQEGDMKEVVTVPAGQGKAIAFPVIPKTLGNIPIVVQAQSYVAADAVRRNLLVEPEGVPQEYSYSVLMNMNATSSFTKTLELALPASTVKGSAFAKISVIGDILGSSFNNLDDLLRMPYGCGEQNMVNFAPNIFILKYLTAVNQVTSAIREKSERYMVQGYQREQTYRHRDGSYSAFGERDPEGSMWLTAFVVKSFAQARKYIYVDSKSVDTSLLFMVRKQNRDGSFPAVGTVHGSYLKGGLKGTFSLTAFVVIALAEAKSESKIVDAAKKNAVRYLENNLDAVQRENDVYGLAISAYALRLVNSGSSATKAWSALLSKAIRKDGAIHWSNAKQKDDKSTEYRPYYRPRSADVEITAYALLTLSLNKDIANGLPVVRWLSQQRNSLGGYSSTQDTVLGIQAMSEFASLIYSPSQRFTVRLTQSADKAFSKTFNVDPSNAMVLQQVLVSKVEGSLKIEANGHGIGMLQVGVTYHVDKAPDMSDFDFVIKVLEAGKYSMKTHACAKWLGEGPDSEMAVMELGVISGFAPDQDAVKKLLKDGSLSVKRAETVDKKLILYFDKISKTKATCIEMRYERTHPVGKGQPVPAVVYDYYHPEHRAEALYTSDKLRTTGVCRVCPMCINCNHALDPKDDPSRSAGSVHWNIITSTFVMVALALLALLF